MIDTQRIVSSQLDIAADALLRGELVVFPTDTVYGVAALAKNIDAVAALYRAKQRPTTIPIPVMVGFPERVQEVARLLPGFWELADAFWPGPLSIVLPKTEALPAIVTAGGDTVALRIPDHPLALALLQRVDEPLAVTSANLSGREPARTAEEARAQLDGRVHVIVDGGPAPGGQPSTIVDLTLSPPEILRRGPVTESMIRETLASTSSDRRPLESNPQSPTSRSKKLPNPTLWR